MDELVLHIRENREILLEIIEKGVVQTKNLSPDILQDCISQSFSFLYHSGLLPSNTIHISKNPMENSTTLVLDYDEGSADLNYMGAVYRDFPLPRILFQFQIENSGRISSVWLKIVPKGRLDNETACFLWPFSNVRHDSSLCLGCNELPHVDDLQRLKHLPRFILELPCNDDLFDSSKNQMGFSLSDLLEHLKDKESSYYYDKILIPQPGEKLAHFLKKE